MAKDNKAANANRPTNRLLQGRARPGGREVDEDLDDDDRQDGYGAESIVDDDDEY